MNTNNVSPLRYPGGKTRACKVIDDTIQKYFTIESFDHLVSPFLGGGSFEFYFQNKYKKPLIVNDKFTPLYNFWVQVKNDKTSLCDRLKAITNVTKEDFIKYRKNILELNGNMLEQAILYFIINRCSFSGATLSGGFSEEASKKRFTESSIERINKLNLDHTTIYNLDFEEFLNNHTTEQSFIFLDPPYYLENKKSNLYGNNGDLHENFNHEKLYQVLTSKQQNWIITYNNCEYIKNLYKDYIIIDDDNINWSYGMNKSKKSSEIIIISRRLTCI